MRYQGRIASWNEPRGFGFIKPEQGGKEIFVHVSALQSDGKLPEIGERVSYQIGTGQDDKPRAVQVFFPDRQLSLAAGSSSGPTPRRVTSDGVPKRQLVPPRSRSSSSRKSNWAGKLISLLALAGLFSLYSRFSAESVAPLPASSLGSDIVSTPQAPALGYRCDGREYCSQMTSCEEATWFLQHCPNTKMDGEGDEGDGVPCESQWCGIQ